MWQNDVTMLLGGIPPIFMLPDMQLMLPTHTILEKYVGY